MLIEVTQKIFFKIITNRLVKILSNNKVLRGKNYAALQNKSTFKPIKVIQKVIEDANIHNKEAWILLMDISKAYDSVSDYFLEQTLKRIKIPESLIQLILDVMEDRHNRVIVNEMLTDSYYIENSIDQGEVWSPILWRIFYDPLLTRLDTLKEQYGYRIKSEKIVDIRYSVKKKYYYY